MIEARDLYVNEALLTGEPYPVEKHADGSGNAEAATPQAMTNADAQRLAMNLNAQLAAKAAGGSGGHGWSAPLSRDHFD